MGLDHPMGPEELDLGAQCRRHCGDIDRYEQHIGSDGEDPPVDRWEDEAPFGEGG